MLRLNNIPLCIPLCTHHIFLIHLSVDGHLRYFRTLAIVNNATLKIVVKILLQDNGFVSLGYIPRSGSYGNAIFNLFEEPPYCGL